MPIDETNPKLRGKKPRISGPWPLGSFPDKVIIGIGRQIVHRMAIGHVDITGDDFGTIFANAIGGEHRGSPLGIADVIMNGGAWSVKTLKHNSPFTQKVVRLISGRISPDYSLGLENPHDNLADTGKCILAVWNARVNESLGEFNELRVAVMMRNMADREFVLFEEIADKYAANDYEWRIGKRGNLEGHNKSTNEHKFTWQFHGSQFTVKRRVPGSAIKFRINQDPPMIEVKHILQLAKFRDDWIEILRG